MKQKAARLAAGTLAGLLAGAPFAWTDPADFSGVWRLDKKRSDDAHSRIEEVAGPAQVKSGGATGLTILPELGTRREVERVELRDWMLSLADRLDELEIRQEEQQIRLYQGEEGVRIFYFGREHVREDARGAKWRCRTRWEGARLILEEEGEKHGAKLTEVFTLLPGGGQLVHAVRFENSLLKDPLDLRLLYDRQAPPGRSPR